MYALSLDPNYLESMQRWELPYMPADVFSSEFVDMGVWKSKETGIHIYNKQYREILKDTSKLVS